MVSDALQAGQDLDSFQIKERIGRGTMTETYRAIDRTTGKQVAIKCIDAEREDTDPSRDLAQFLARADHLATFTRDYFSSPPQMAALIPRILKSGIKGGLHWIATEYIEGITLREHLSKLSSRDNLVLSMVRSTQIAYALGAAHAAFVLHGDLKPESILLTETGPGVAVLDLGCAALFGGQTAALAARAPLYKAPEQLGEAVTPDKRADVYALGAILFEMMALRAPFSKPDGSLPHTFQLITLKAHSEPSPLAAILSGFPPSVSQVAQKALAIDPGHRHASMPDFAEVLEDALADYVQWAQDMEDLAANVGGSRDMLEQFVATQHQSGFQKRDAADPGEELAGETHAGGALPTPSATPGECYLEDIEARSRRGKGADADADAARTAPEKHAEVAAMRSSAVPPVPRSEPPSPPPPSPPPSSWSRGYRLPAAALVAAMSFSVVIGALISSESSEPERVCIALGARVTGSAFERSMAPPAPLASPLATVRVSPRTGVPSARPVIEPPAPASSPAKQKPPALVASVRASAPIGPPMPRSAAAVPPPSPPSQQASTPPEPERPLASASHPRKDVLMLLYSFQSN